MKKRSFNSTFPISDNKRNYIGILAPDGNLHQCEYGGHSKLAFQLIYKNISDQVKKDFHKKKGYLDSIKEFWDMTYVEYVSKLGYVRLEYTSLGRPNVLSIENIGGFSAINKSKLIELLENAIYFAHFDTLEVQDNVLKTYLKKEFNEPNIKISSGLKNKNLFHHRNN